MEAQLLDQDGQEEEDLCTPDGLTDAAPLPHPKNHHLLCIHLIDSNAVGIQETLGAKRGRVLPQCRVMVHLPLIDEDAGVLGDEVPIQCGVFSGAMWDSEGQEGRMSE